MQVILYEKKLLIVFFQPHGISSPFLNDLLHIGRRVRFKIHCFMRSGMNETERLGMQGTARANLKTVFYKLFVFAVNSAF